MFRSDKEFFKHIFDEIFFLESETEKLNEEMFLRDDKSQRAFARSIEIIGEAVKNLSNDVILQNPQVKWRNIAGMRDKLIHGYFSVNNKLVWDVAKNVIPKFKKDLQDIKERNPEKFG